MKLLGVTFSSDLSWCKHIDNIVSISSRRLYAHRVIKPFVSKDFLLGVYFAIVRNLVEYCSPLLVGINTKLSAKLDQIQRRAHRIICDQNCDCDRLPPLVHRRCSAAKKLVLLSLHDAEHLLHALLPRASASKRNDVRFLFEPYSTSRRQTSCIPYTCINLI